jgi:acyl carrier protein
MQAKYMVPTVCSIISDVCGIGVEQIEPDMRLAACGLDSVRAINLLLALEETFNISIPDEVGSRVRTVREVIMYLEGRLRHAASEPEALGT